MTSTAIPSGRPIFDVAPTVDVIICAHTLDRWDDLLDSIESVARQSKRANRVIVVIDHAPELLARLADRRDVTVIDNDGPKGLAAARNCGVAASTADIAAFIDDDAVADPAWLSSLIPAYANPFVLGVGGQSAPAWDGERPSWFPEEFDWVVGCTYRGMPTKTAEVRNMIGSNMSFRRDVLVDLDGFRSGSGRVAGSSLPMGNEETELCIRAMAAEPDSIFVFEPAARVRHRVRAERGTTKYFVRRCWAEGLSKSWTAKQSNGARVLTTERTYVRRTLPRAVGRSFGDIVLRRRPGGAGRVLAIVAGVVATGTGYARARLARAFR